MKKLLLVITFLGLVSYINSQNAKAVLSFEKKTHDFGEVKEDGGPVAYSFEFTNTGTQPLVIHTVQASCGCTSPDWTRTPIQPGSKGFVKATYDPRGRPGPINKTVTVTTNAEPSTEILRINGNVLAKEKTMEDIYPRQIDVIRLKSSALSFTKIEPGMTKNERLEFINPSSEPVTITFDKVPEHLKMKVEPATIPAGATGSIVATFDASKKQDWGFVNDQAYLIINGNKSNDYRISVSATIEEDYSKWNADQMANAPVIEFSETMFDFGDIKKGEKVTHIFTIKNTGKSNLNLRKVSSSCGCTTTQPDKNIIAANETASITVTFDSRGRNNRQNQTITVLSNDPKKSNQSLRISANIVE
jgi:hypothetical protein